MEGAGLGGSGRIWRSGLWGFIRLFGVPQSRRLWGFKAIWLWHGYCARKRRRRRLLVTTDTLEKLMAALAIMGLSSHPVMG